MKLFEQTADILMELSGLDNIKPEDSLKDTLALDSLSMVTLLIEIEDRFGIRLNESDMDPNALASVEDVYELVKKYRSEDDE